jgi:hypothetical protein
VWSQRREDDVATQTKVLTVRKRSVVKNRQDWHRRAQDWADGSLEWVERHGRRVQRGWVDDPAHDLLSFYLGRISVIFCHSSGSQVR